MKPTFPETVSKVNSNRLFWDKEYEIGFETPFDAQNDQIWLIRPLDHKLSFSLQRKNTPRRVLNGTEGDQRRFKGGIFIFLSVQAFLNAAVRQKQLKETVENQISGDIHLQSISPMSSSTDQGMLRQAFLLSCLALVREVLHVGRKDPLDVMIYMQSIQTMHFQCT